MLEETFSHDTIRKYVAAVGTIFNGISIYRGDKKIAVPLRFTDKEKFIKRCNEINSADDNIKIKETLPRMGFNLNTFQFSSIRKTNTMARIVNESNTKSMFNRVPYDFQFSVYIAARNITDGLRIVEQIAPYFTPELGLRINTLKEFPEMIDDIPIILDGITPDIDSEGDMDERRVLSWELNLTLKGYLYTNIKSANVIKKTIVELRDSDVETFFSGVVNRVNPEDAEKNEPHEIETICLDRPYNQDVLSGLNGATLNVDLE